MLIIELITILVTIAGLFIWNRAESRSDVRHMDNKLDTIREMMHSIHKETQASINGMREEMKDFHNRLCEIERNRK